MLAFKDRVFSKITTMGKLPDGRIIDRTISYPNGADYNEYLRLDEALVRAFGSINCRTVGTPFYPTTPGGPYYPKPEGKLIHGY